MAVKEKPRRPPPPPPPVTDYEIARAIDNLHDVFLTLSFLRTLMDATLYAQTKEVADRPPWKRWGMFTISDRSRLERLWVSFLVVLVEAWESAPESIRSKIGQLVHLAPLTSLLQQKEQLEKLRSVRAYMVHRDLREYWDPARTAVAGELPLYSQLHNQFSRILLPAMEWANSVLEKPPP